MSVIEPTLGRERMLLRTHPVIVACDEVGRGALAGPVAVGAVAVDASHAAGEVPSGLRDSKLVPVGRRDEVARRARDWVIASTVGWASAAEIDRVGITRALGMAAVRAVRALADGGVALAGGCVLLDGNHDYITPVADVGVPVLRQIKADRDCASAAAASIIAKVTRDAEMVRLHEAFPPYEWERNKGYGSLVHREAIRSHGLSPHHRASWAIGGASPGH